METIFNRFRLCFRPQTVVALPLIGVLLLLVSPLVSVSAVDAERRNDYYYSARGPITVWEAVSGDLRLSTLKERLEEYDLDELLDGEEPVTLFAPINSAFNEIPHALQVQLDEDPNFMQKMLEFHILEESTNTRNFRKGDSFESVLHLPVHVESVSPLRLSGGARVISRDNEVANGVIHIVDQFLVPRTYINEDVELDIVGIRDTYRDPQGTAFSGFISKKNREAAQTQSLYDVLSGGDMFTSLMSAVDQAGLREALKAVDSPLTIFAPTNKAFGELTESQKDNLENVNNLRRLLKNHVIPGAVTHDDLWKKLSTFETLQGRTIRVDGRSGLRVENAKIIGQEIGTSNGVIYVIDSVFDF